MLLDREPDLRVVGRTHSASECHRYLAGSEGIGLIDEMRGSCPDARVMVLTISIDPEEHARAREAGAEEVLSKSDDLLAILAAISTLELLGWNCAAPEAFALVVEEEYLGRLRTGSGRNLFDSCGGHAAHNLRPRHDGATSNGTYSVPGQPRLRGPREDPRRRGLRAGLPTRNG